MQRSILQEDSTGKTVNSPGRPQSGKTNFEESRPVLAGYKQPVLFRIIGDSVQHGVAMGTLRPRVQVATDRASR